MFKRILIALGLASAPRPLKSYMMASSFVGTGPALAFVAWRYRNQLMPALGQAKRVLHRATPAASAHPVSQAV
jgi:hypothetical protein